MSQFGNSATFVNGSGYAQSREATHDGYAGERDVVDERMEQIRDLILGDLRRSWDARLQTLETRLQTLEDKVDAVRHDMRAGRQEHVAALAAGIDELGQHVRRLNRS